MAAVLRQLWADSELRAVNCYSCSVEFAITNDMYQQRLSDHRQFYCPNGHAQYFTGLTPEQKRIRELEAQVAREKANAESAQRARSWAETNARGARIAEGKAKAAKKRLEHRVNCGVCPHCQRTFKQLAAHMKSKHGK